MKTVTRVWWAYAARLMGEGALIGFAVVALVAAVFVWIARWGFEVERTTWDVVVWIILGVGTLLGALIALRRSPSRAVCRARLEDASRAGGLFLVSDYPNASTWPRPKPNLRAAIRVSPIIPRRILALLYGLALFLPLALLYPHHAVSAAKNSTVPTELLEELQTEITELMEEAPLEPEEVEVVRTEVQAQIAQVDQVGAAETVDALNRLATRLKQVSATAVQAERLNSRQMNLSATEAEKAALDLADALRKCPTYRSCRSTCTNGCACCNSCGENGTSGTNESGESVGSGGVDRGRADAPLTWGDEVALAQSAYRDEARDSVPIWDDATKVGEAMDTWESPAASTPQTPSAQPLSHAFGVGATPARILPRHRHAVKTYFSAK